MPTACLRCSGWMTEHTDAECIAHLRSEVDRLMDLYKRSGCGEEEHLKKVIDNIGSQRDGLYHKLEQIKAWHQDEAVDEVALWDNIKNLLGL